MALFLSTFVNKIDKKGRVSVPASFRSALADQTFQGIVAYPSFVLPAIEACGMDRMDALSRGVDRFTPFSDEHDAFANALFGDSNQLPWDGEGRVILPQALREAAGLDGLAAFVGQGATFQIWEPDAAARNREAARQRAHTERAAFSLRPGEDGP